MTRQNRFRSQLPSLFEQLEERVLFDGVPDATIILPSADAGHNEPAQVASLSYGQQDADHPPRQLVLIDGGIENSEDLLLSLINSNQSDSFEIRHIDSQSDGVQQITDLLAEGGGARYSGIHILSHGQAGEVELGSSSLNNDNVRDYLDEITSWSDALTEDADILFYGCDLAGDQNGESLIETISNLTGADVAASTDLTGNNADRSANWNLEYTSGRVETLALAATAWNGTLMVEATNGAVTIQDAEFTGSGTVTLVNNAQPENVTVIGTPTRVGQMLERVWTFSETGDVGRATYVFDVSGISGINATIASEFGLIVSDQSDLADGPNTTTLVASGYDAVNGLVYFHQVDLNDGDYFGLATEVVQDNFSINPTATGLEDTSIDLGLTLSPSLTQGGALQDVIATATGFRGSSAGTTTTDFFIPAGTTGIRITGYSTADIGTTANDAYNDDYQFLNVSIDLETETSNGYIGNIIDQGPSRSDQFGWEEAPLGADILTGGGTITGDADDNVNPTFTIVDGVLMIEENHSLQTGYHVEFLTNATSSSEFIQASSAVREDGDLTDISLAIPANADFLVINIADAATGTASAHIEYKGNSRIYLDLTTLTASGVVAAQEGETDDRVITYGFEDYDVSSASVGSILSAAGTIAGDDMSNASVFNDNQIYIDGSGNLVIDRDATFAANFNSLVTVEYYDRKDAGSSAEQLGESTVYELWNSDPSNPTSTMDFDIPENATLGILNLTANGISTNNTNENMGAAFAVIDLVNGVSSGSIYMVRASGVVDLVGWDGTDFGTAFFDDPNSISNHTSITQFNDPFAGTAAFNLTNGGTTLELAVNSDSGGSQTFLDYYAGGQIEWFGAAPFEISGFTNGGVFSQGTFNTTTGNWELSIADAQAGLAYIPPEHVSGTVPVDVTLRIGDESEVTSVTIQAVIDPIDFSAAPDACGDEDTDIPISVNVTPVFVDQDGSETLTSQVLSNVPIGHTLSDGTNTFVSSAGSQSVDITAWDTTAITYRANPNESGTFTITQDVDWQDVGGGVTDTDSVTETFDVIVKPVNDPPVAVDDFYTVLGNTTLTVPAATGVLINDSDTEGDTLTVNTTPVSGPSNGSVTLNTDGTFTYTPTTGFFGTDSFDYEVSDGNGGVTTATAFIDVSEPVTGPLEAMDDMVTTNEETLVNINVMANDDLPTTGAFNIQSTTPPSNGSITVLADGTIDYTPNVDFFGTDTFTYTLADASGRTSTATVTVTVVNVQDPPVANADSGSTPEDTVLPSINILANDSDPDNDTLTVTTATAPNGTVMINPDGTIDYTPNPGFNGTDTVTYTISDGNGGTATSTVLINVVPVADPPTSADNSVTTSEEVPYAFSDSDFAFADQDPADSLVAVRIDTLPADGQLLLNGNAVTASQVISLSDLSGGNLLFVPDPDGNGAGYATFDFSVTDGVLFQTSPNTMTVNVKPVQDPPVATDNAITVAEESVGTPLGLASPTDVDGDTLTATVTGLPTLGTVFLADGVTPVNNGDTLTVAQLTSLVFDAPTDFTVASAGSFTYDISDGIATDSGQVDITITPVNDPPVVDLNGSGAGEDHADTFTEGASPVSLIDANGSFTDPDDTRLALLKISVDPSTIVDAGQEFLTIGGTDFQLDATANSTTTVTIGASSYDVTFTAATSSFEIVRAGGIEMTLAQARVVLLNTDYRNDSALPTVGDREFDVCANDGDDDSNIATTTISVVRDAETAAWSITGPATVVDGSNATFVVELSDPLRDGETAFVDLGLTNIDTNSADLGTLNAAVTAAVAAYAGPGSLAWDGTTLTFTSDGTGAMAPLSIAMPTTPDGVYEGDEDFQISLSNPGSSTGETITIDPVADDVVTTIIDNTPAPTLTIGDGSATEGSPVEFELSLDVSSFEAITVDLATATGTATAGADFETTNFEYFDGTAWVAATNGTEVTIPAGQTSLMVRVDSVQEGLVEPDETFTLSASVLSGTVTSASDLGVGTIVNDDNSLISIDDVMVDEDNGTMTFTISLDQSPTGAVSVDWATANGSTSPATSGVDFVSASGTASFIAGQQTQTVVIAITNDNLYEGPETLNVNLSNASGGTITDGLGIGTIFDNGAGPNGTDDDRPVISIDNVTATEGTDPFAVFTVSLSNPSVENTVLSLVLADVSAVEGSDFGTGLEFFDGTAWQPVTGNVTIAAGATSIQVRTAIIDDPIADSGETYTLMVAQVSGTTANSGATGTGTILDEAIPDPTLVSITGPASVTEGSSATYDLVIDNVPLTNVTITFTYSGTASGGTDYSGVASVTIPAGSTTATVTIPTIDDTLGEPLENFTITIDSVTGGSLEALQIDPTDFEVTTDIVDDDIPTIMVNDVFVTEGSDAFAVFTVELSNPTFENITFDLSATGVTATGNGVDFGVMGMDDLEVFVGGAWVPATSATIAAGDTTLLMRTAIIDDAEAEMTLETFTVTVMPTAGTTSNPSNTGTGTIQEDTTSIETILVSLTGPASVVEGATTTDYTLSLDDASGPINAFEDVTISLVYTGVAADGTDFTGVATVTIPAGSASATFTLPTVNDSLYEDSEDIIISIDAVSGGGFEGIAADPLADMVTTLIIDDADIPTVSINNVTSIEGTDNFAVYTIELSNLSVENVDVSLALAGGTATAGGVDFGAAGAGNLQVFNGTAWVDATTATIAAGDMSVQVRTPIVDDPIDEPTENYTLTVNVTAGTTTNIQVIGLGTILDDDPAPDVTIDDATATEGDQLVFNVTLSNPSSTDIVLDFTATDNTTSGAADYASTFEYSTNGGTTWIAATGGSEVTIPAGSGGVLVRTLTTEDTTLEPTETLDLSIASVVSGLVGDTTDTALGTIIDDDVALVSIVANDPSASEPSDDAQFTVSMSNPSDSPTTIAYTVSGPANSGIDYAALSGMITLPAGVTSDTIDLSVIDDLIVEGNEDVTITLTSIVSGDAQVSIDGTADSDTATIADDDIATWSIVGDAGVTEGADAKYIVNLAGTLQAGETATIDLNIGNITAIAADFGNFVSAVNDAITNYSGPGTLAFDGTTLTFTSDGSPMGDLCIEVEAVDDALVEGSEDFQVSIANPGTTTGITVVTASPTIVVTTITDNDIATWNITGDPTVAEGADAKYTVNLAGTLQTGETATIDLNIGNVTAIAADYGNFVNSVNDAITNYVGPGSLVFDGTTLTFTSDGSPMGDLCIEVEAVDDALVESSEDFQVSIANPGTTTGSDVVTASPTIVVTTITDNDAATWSIGVDNADDEGATVQYTVALAGAFGAGESVAVDLSLNDVDTNSGDYANFVAAVNAAVGAYAGPGTLAFDGTTLTFTATTNGDAMTDLVIDLMLTDDAIAEGTETFTVDLANAAGPTGASVSVDVLADSVTTTINDTMGIAGAPDEVVFSITGPATGPEGTTAQYTVELTGAVGSGESVSVEIGLNDIDTNSADYASFTAAVTAAAATDPNVSFNAGTGVLTYTAPTDGATMSPLLINLGLNTDAIVEGDEDFEVELSNASSSTGVAVSIDPAESDVVTTITDTTAPLEWEITGPVAADEGGTAEFTIALDGAVGDGESVSVEVDLADLTTNPNDYDNFDTAIAAAIAGNPDLMFDAATGTLTFTAPSDGATMPPIVIDLGIVDDAFIEGPEQFTVSLSNPGSTTGASTTISATDDSVTTEINDTDGLGMGPDTAQFTLTGDNTVAETGTAEYVLELSGQFGANETAIVDLSLSNVDTTSADYLNFVAAVNTAVSNYAGAGTVTFDGTTLTFTAGADGDSMSPLTIELDAVDDTLVEGDEDYSIAISNAASTTGGEVVLGAATSVTTTITDNDTAAFSLTGDATVGEGADAKYVLALSGTLQAGETATIDLNIGNVTAIAADYGNFASSVNDAISSYTGPGSFAFDGTTLTFTSDGNPMGDLCIEVEAIDDGLVEGSEDFQVSIANPGTTTGSDVVTAGPTIVVTTITDNDIATWSISGAATIAEGADAKYIVNLAGTLQSGETATVDLNIGNVTAIAADYGAFVTAVNDGITNYTGPGTLAFDGTTLTFTSDGSPMGDLCVEVEAIDDVLIEGDEDFQVSIANPGTTTGSDVVTANPTIVVTTITDNDTASFSLTGDATVGEGSNAKYVLALAGTLQAGETATIDLSIDDADTNLADYANFVAAVNTAISSYTGPGSLAFDGATLTFTSDGNSMDDLCIELTAIDDALVEGPEDYTISIANPSTTTGSDVAVGGTAVVTTTITDNDIATWSISGDATVAEGADAKYIVNLAGTLQSGETATVDLNIGNVTAIAADYGAFVSAVNDGITNYTGPGTLVFDGTTLTFTSDGSPMGDLCIEVEAIDDALIEGDEDFQVSIANPGTTTGSDVVTANPTIVVTTITDNDTATFSLTGDATVGEGSNAKYVLALAGTLQAGETATIDLGLADADTTSADYANFVTTINTAIANYAGPGVFAFDGTTLTFTSDGNPMDDLCIELNAIDDALVEGSEDFMVSIANPGTTTGSDVAVGGTTLVTTTITDNDTATWSITGDPVVAEGADAKYIVNLIGTLQSGETATVDLNIGNVTAIAPDYGNFVTAVNDAIASYTGPGTLAFDGTTLTFTSDGNPMGDLCIEVDAIDDALVEGSEDFQVSIANPGTTTGSDVVTANPTIVVTTIIDNGVAAWSITGDPTVAEGADAKYIVNLSGTLQAGETATVDLNIGNVIAVAADYGSFVSAVNDAIANYTGPGTLAFDGTTLTFTSDGNLMGDLCIEVEAIDDTLVEGSEDFQVSIANPGTTTGSNVVAASTTIVVTTITDNDTATWSITGDPTVAEGADAKYVVNLAGTLQAGETATIDLNIGNLTAIAPDYGNFSNAVNDAITNYTGPGTLAFDGTTLTFTSDGNPMGDLCIEVEAVDDALIEGSEDFQVSIANPSTTTGSDVVAASTTIVVTTITDNDTATWSITGDPTVAEGADAKYVVNLAETLQSGETATIDLNIGNLTAIAPDYGNFVTAVNDAIASYTGPGTLAFDGTTLTFTSDGRLMGDLCIEVEAVDDTLIEGSEDFQVSIANPGTTTGSDVVTASPTIVVTTINDNDAATWSLAGDTLVTEGDVPQYTVSFAGTLQPGETATIELSLSDVDTNSADYANFVSAVNAAIGARTDLAFDGLTLTYTGDGNPMANLVVDLTTVDDLLSESTESLNVSLAAPGSTTGSSVLGSGLVTTAIQDNDALTWSITGTAAVDEGGLAQYKIGLLGTIQSGEQASVELTLADLETGSVDYTNFIAAIQTAVASRSDLAFDAATATLTVTGNGSPMPDLCVDLTAVDDAFVEGPERFQILLSNATSPGGLIISVDPTLSLVTTTINDTVGDGGALEEAVWALGVDQTVPEGSPASYQLSLSGNLQNGEVATVELSLSDIDTIASDYASFSLAVSTAVSNYAGPGTLTWNGTTLTFRSDGSGPMAGLSVSLGTVNDGFAEGPEDFLIAISNNTSPTGLATAIDATADDATTTIDDTVGAGADDTVWAVNGSLAVDEGGSASYFVSLTGTLGAGEVASVDIGLADLETVGSDYASFSAAVASGVAFYNASFDPGSVAWDGTTLTYTAANDGDVFGGLTIGLGAFNDTLLEGPERYQITISNASSASAVTVGIDAARNNVITTINDTLNDGGPIEPGAQWSITGSPSVNEGSVAAYRVELTGDLQAGEETTVGLQLSDIETNGADYAVFSTAIATAVADYNADPASTGSLTWDGVSLTFTSDGTGQMSGLDIDLASVGDTVVEGDERYNVLLSNPTSSTGLTPTLSATESVVTTTIVDDDTATWSITGDATVPEGADAKYIVNLSGTLQVGETATIDLNIGNVTAIAADYGGFVIAVNSAIANYTGPGTLAFSASTLTFTSDGSPMGDLCIEVEAVDDILIEGDEDFQVSIANPGSTTGSEVVSASTTIVATTIVDNDAAQWNIVGDTLVNEGGVSQYTVSLLGVVQAGATTQVDLGLSNVDTTSSDYANFVNAVNAAISGRTDLAFDGQVLTYTGDGSAMADLLIDLGTVNDVFVEGDEDFTVSISNPTSSGGNVALGGSVAVTTTVVDDDLAAWSFAGDATVGEGGQADYQLSLSGTLQPGEIATIELGLADVDTESSDYLNFVSAVNVAIAGRSDLAFDGTTLTYTGDGSPMIPLTISIDAIDDSLVESTESYTVSIANSGSTSGIGTSINGTSSVATSIVDNDAAVWSITGDTNVLEGNAAGYTLLLDGILESGGTASVDINLSEIDTTAGDHTSLLTQIGAAIAGRTDLSLVGSTLTFTSSGAAMVPLTFSIDAVDDAFSEGVEDYLIALASASASGDSSVSIDSLSDQVTTTVDDTSGPGADAVTFTLTGDNNVDEGGSATYSLSTVGAIGAGDSVSVDLLLTDIDTNSNDYVSFSTSVASAVADYNSGGNPGFLSWDGTTLTFVATADGDSINGLQIDVAAANDSLLEGPEDYQVSIVNASTATGGVVSIDPVQDNVVTTVNDTLSDGGPAEPGAVWSLVGDASVLESGSINYSLDLSGLLQSGEEASVQLLLSDVDTSSSDYQSFTTAVADAVTAWDSDPANNGTLSWDGSTLSFVSDGGGVMGTFEFALPLVDDALIEGDESLSVALSNPLSSTGLTPSISAVEDLVVTTVVDNDSAQWSIAGPVGTSEGNSATYAVSLGGTFGAGESVSVAIGIADVDTDSSDYGDLIAAISAAAAARPDLTFDSATGELSYTAPADGAMMADLLFDLPILSDGISEAPEDFVIALSNANSSSGVAVDIASVGSSVTTTINGSPVLQPDSYTTSSNTPLNGNVLDNDSDPDGDTLTVTQVEGQPIGAPIVTDCGTVLMNPDGSFTFTPNPGFFGVDTFTYTVVDSAGNQETTTVEITIVEARVGLAKSASDPVANGENFDVTFTLFVDNLGNALLDNLSLIDDVNAVFGSGFVAASVPVVQNWTGVGAAPVANAAWVNDSSQNLLASGSLAENESFEVVFTVTLDPDAAGAPAAPANQAEISGLALNPDGTPAGGPNSAPQTVNDLSDAGTDPAGENGTDNNDGVFANDPTQILIADLGIAKTTVGEPELLFSGNFVVTYQVVVGNTGTVSLADLSLLEDLSAQFGNAFVNASDLSLVAGPSDIDSSVAVSGSFDGSSDTELLSPSQTNSLAVGDSFTLQFSIEIDPLAVSGSVGNQISGSGAAVDANGDPILGSDGNPVLGNDLSDSGSDPGSSNPDDPFDTGSSADVTGFTPPELPLGEISGLVFVDQNGNGLHDAGEDGIQGVEIRLVGTDTYGDPVDRVVTTDASGRFVFAGLNAGVYQLIETQPADFTDGEDRGEQQALAANDQFSNIVLNWGQSLDRTTFAERASGTSGTPPTFPVLPPLVSSPITSLLSSYTNSSPIYSGTFIASNGQPLTLDSNAAIGGGYSGDGSMVSGVEVDACECDCDCGPAEEVSQVVVADECGSCEVVEQTVIEQDQCCESDIVVGEEGECVGDLPQEEVCQPCDPCEAIPQCEKSPNFLRGSFLRRMGSWLRN